MTVTGKPQKFLMREAMIAELGLPAEATAKTAAKCRLGIAAPLPPRRRSKAGRAVNGKQHHAAGDGDVLQQRLAVHEGGHGVVAALAVMAEKARRQAE